MLLWVWLGDRQKEVSILGLSPLLVPHFLPPPPPSFPPGLECCQVAEGVMRYPLAKYLNTSTYKRGPVATK